MNQLTSIEVCAGAGGQALGLETAGFDHSALVELEPVACATLRLNRPSWSVIEGDLRKFDGRPYQGIDLLAGGVPCPPFSKAGKQLGAEDERDLFPEAIRLVDECRPQAVMLENARAARCGLRGLQEQGRKAAQEIGLRPWLEAVQRIGLWRFATATARCVCGHPQGSLRWVLLAGTPEG